MGTGVGEALLIGAATGAGTSALTGGDPLKGALFGALGGGVTSGLGSALGGAQAGQAMGTAGSTAANVGTNVGAATTGNYAGANIGANLGTTAAGSLDDLIASGLSREAAEQSMLNAQSGLTSGPITQTGANLAPKTGFMDIFKPTEGGPDLKQRLGNYIVQNPYSAQMSGAGLANTMFNQPDFSAPSNEYEGPLKRFRFNPSTYRPAFAEGGGITDIDLGSTAQLTGSPVTMMASGGIADLGSYSDGGRLLKGPGDGMSDSIPARIGRRQPARLADGEFVVPADVVSHLGNGSTDAGAKQLYAMMDKVRRARTGNKKQGREINPRKFVPA